MEKKNTALILNLSNINYKYVLVSVEILTHKVCYWNCHDRHGKAYKSWLDLVYIVHTLHNTWNHYLPLNMFNFLF